jgi:hypothetical protein
VTLLPRNIRPRKEWVVERVKSTRWPPALGEEGGGASGLGESAAGELDGCSGGTADPDADARRGRMRVLGIGRNGIVAVGDTMEHAAGASRGRGGRRRRRNFTRSGKVVVLLLVVASGIAFHTIRTWLEAMHLSPATDRD